MLELALDPLVTVEPNAHAEGHVRRELDEAEPEVAVEDVEVVLVDVDVASVEREAWRLTVRGRSMTAARSFLHDAETGDLLLRHTDHDDALVALEASQMLASNLFLAAATFEADDRHALA